MKKNLLLRLCLILMVALTIYSCRTDQFPEKETYDNSSAFQLTAKTISLEQSKDKEKLLSIVSNAGSDLKKLTNPGLGDEIVVDTDHVVYIENGPNYHTYTFNIKRENAPEDAPLENLVLSPLTDGTYRKLLFTYHLTPQEKQTIMMGGFLDTKEKIEITELGTGAYAGVFQKQETCFWKTITIAVPCVNGHKPGQKCDLKGSQRPYLLTESFYVCEEGYHEGGGGNSNPTPPSGGGCSPNGALTGPQIPNDGMGMTPCGGGIPTLPNLPDTVDDPCEKIKKQREDTDFTNKVTDLKGKTGIKKETGYIQRTNGEYTYKDNASATDQANELSLPNADEPENKDIISYLHTHVNDFTYDNPSGEGIVTKQGIKIFSPADINYFMKMIKNAYDAGRFLGDVYAVMVTSKENYQLRFTGNKYQIKIFTEDQLKIHSENFKKFMEENGMRKSKDLEFNMLKYMEEKMILKGVALYRMNSDGTTTEIKLNADKTDREENNCPN